MCFLNHESRSFLKETAKWAKFLAIVGFIFVGLMVLFALMFGTIMGTTLQDAGPPLSSGFFTIFYLIFAGIYVLPILYLFRFATKMQMALKDQDQQSLSSSFENIKSHYKFVGILMVVILGIYALGILFAIIGGAAGMMMG